ncbi:vesicle transport protein SFT2B-like [Watersipora subatra]|uniref:vesicle transport protein SFT2B-like n=1 Tax=Watersipora subatra TaxID=2589382 RepID=UPI00355C9C0E
MGLTSLKRYLNGQEEEDDDGILTQVSSATTLSWSTRIKGFIACFVAGIVCSLLSSFLWVWSVAAFVVLYSIGTILSLCSTMFLLGPLKQLKRMADPTRIICTIVLLVCIVLTILSALLWDSVPLAIIFCIIQFLALAWYSISYIPFARDAVIKGATSCCA